MSLRHSASQAATWALERADQPWSAACWDAATADFSALPADSSVSTPTYLTNSYDWSLRARKVSAWLAVRFAAGVRVVVAVTPGPEASVEATAPAVLRVSASNVTSWVR